MSRIRELLQTFDRQALDKHTEKLRAVTALNRTLRQEIRDLRDAVTRLTELTRTLQVRTEQLATLRQADATAAAQLARLAPLLDVERVAAHVQAGVASGVLTDDPVPHLVLTGLFPEDAYRALLEALPPRVVFEDRPADRCEIRLPPRLAPVASIVAWEFLTTAILRPTLAPALIDRFQLPSPSSISAGHLVLYSTGRPVSPIALQRHGLTTIVSLSHPEGRQSIDIQLYRIDGADGEYQPTRRIALVANAAVTLGLAPGAYDVVVPSQSTSDRERYAWRFDVGVEPASAQDAGECLPE